MTRLPRAGRVLLLATLAGCGPGGEAEAGAAPDSIPTAPAAPEVAPPAAPGSDTARVGLVCPDPRHPCPGFRDHDLSFVLPRDEVARAEVRSDSFFAVILRSGARCSITEADRAPVQAGFPDRKVFAERAMCEDDVENNVAYTGVSDSVSFLAVFAGRDRPAADSALAEVQRSGRFPGANLRRMQVVFMIP